MSQTTFHFFVCFEGGDNNKGTVMSFIAFKSNVSNGWVRVKWAVTNIVGEYRLGAEGAVEVVASKLENGGQVYADHLPVVGEYVMNFPGPEVKKLFYAQLC